MGASLLPDRALDTGKAAGRERAAPPLAHGPVGVRLDGQDGALANAVAAVIARERIDLEQAEEGVGLVQSRLRAGELAGTAADAGVGENPVAHSAVTERLRRGDGAPREILRVERPKLGQARGAGPGRHVDAR